jgi:hypothetical protein
MFLYRLVDALHAEKVDYAIAGGTAVALHGAVRGTIDVDLVIRIDANQFAAAERALKNMGLVCRQPLTAQDLFANRLTYVREKNLIAWNFYNPKDPLEEADILVVWDLASMTSVEIVSSGRKLKVVSIADLIRMKKVSARPQDLEDVRALERLKK